MSVSCKGAIHRGGNAAAMLEFVEKRFREPIRLADLAGHLGLPEESAGKQFARFVGQLLGTDDEITGICFDSGFQSLSTFYRVLAADAGYSPQAFRDRRYGKQEM